DLDLPQHLADGDHLPDGGGGGGQRVEGSCGRADRGQGGYADLDPQVLDEGLGPVDRRGLQPFSDRPGLEGEVGLPEVGAETAAVEHVDGEDPLPAAAGRQGVCGRYRRLADSSLAGDQNEPAAHIIRWDGEGCGEPGDRLPPTTWRRR